MKTPGPTRETRARALALALIAMSFLLLLAILPAHAQEPLTLQKAVQIALEKNPMCKAAIADEHAADAGVMGSRSFLLPHVQFGEGFMRGDDPVFVFGTKLRQERFSAADFALPALNTPPPINNFATRVGTTWNLFDSGASWFALSRSRKLKDAASQQLVRTDQELVYRVVDAYYHVLLANREQAVAEQAEKTAAAVLDRAKARYGSGMVVESDLLAAQVDEAERQQELIRARNAVALARAQLDHEMGISLEQSYQPAEALAERALPVAPLDELEKKAIDDRPDLRGLRLQQEAQNKGVAGAKAAFGPRLNAFVNWEADNRDFTGNGGNNWMGGVELQLDIFQGGAKLANLNLQKAYAERIAAARENAESAVRLEVRQAYLDLDANRQQVDVARASVAQAQDSLRINQNRYDEGLVTITDLLRAEEASRRAETDYWLAVYRLQTSYARLELATGTLNAQSAVVMP